MGAKTTTKSENKRECEKSINIDNILQNLALLHKIEDEQLIQSEVKKNAVDVQ